MSSKRNKSRKLKKKKKLILVKGIEKVVRRHVVEDNTKIFNHFGGKYKEINEKMKEEAKQDEK